MFAIIRQVRVYFSSFLRPILLSTHGTGALFSSFCEMRVEESIFESTSSDFKGGLLLIQSGGNVTFLGCDIYRR